MSRALAAATLLAACSGAAPAAGPIAAADPTGLAGTTIAPSHTRGPAVAPPAAPALRLPDGVVPRRYALDLTIDPAKPDFHGVVDIDLELKQTVSQVWLHATGLVVDRATLTAGGHVITTYQMQTSSPDFFGLGLSRALSGGATLSIAYHGTFYQDDYYGLFRQLEGGKAYVFSQFEAIGARRAVPCFDEPALKAPWQLTLHVPAADLALSNQAATSETPEADGMKAVLFAETPPLPSYLVALAVGPFEVHDAGTAGLKHTPITVVAPAGRAVEAGWSGKTAAALLPRLEDYFAQPYPFDKLDLVAVPQMFGAMENPGLITFDEQLLLDDGDASIEFQRASALTLAHEMAHLWFGDLVTMAWWDDLWLNESFADWLSHKLVAAWKPSWHVDLEVLGSRAGAFAVDQLASAHRLHQPIDTMNDIEGEFDSIAYAKGQSVLGMIEHLAGGPSFERAVRRYLTRFAWKNATGDDFLAALRDAGAGPAADATKSFLDQSGAPLVALATTCAAGRATVHLEQSRLAPLGGAAKPDDSMWQLPVCLRVAGVRKPICQVLDHRKVDVALPGKGCPAWVVGNADASGYYLVAYDDAARRALARAPLSLAERVELARSLPFLVAADRLPIGDALAALAELFRRKEPELVSAAVDVANALGREVGDDQRAAWSAWLVAHAGKPARALGWTPKRGEAEAARLLRPALLGLAALDGDDAALQAAAVPLARAYLAKPALADDLAEVVLAAAARADGSLHAAYLGALAATTRSGPRDALIAGLAGFRDAAAIADDLALALGDGLESNERQALLEGPLAYPEARAAAYDFIEGHLAAILARHPIAYRAIWLAIGESFCDADHRARAAKILGPALADAPGGADGLAETLERQDVCIAVRAKLAPDLGAALKRQ